MRLEDWRNLPPALVLPLYEAEVRRWRLSLQWDLTPTVETIEAARSGGVLPGFVLRGPGQSIIGWSYFVVQDGVVQIGSLLARSASGVRLLLDAMLRAPEAAAAEDVLLFALPETAALESALARRRFDITRYWFLRRTLDTSQVERQATAHALRPLHDNDGPDAVRLLSRGYEGLPTARCFAPHGELDEWARYFAQITKGRAIGTLVPAASLVARTPDHRPVGLALSTTVGPGTLHLAQLVVDPSARRRGVAAQLLDAVMAWGSANRHPLMTLLVSDDNAPARHLYASRGFLPTGYFLSARRAPLRKTYDVRPAVAVRPVAYPR